MWGWVPSRQLCPLKPHGVGWRAGGGLAEHVAQGALPARQLSELSLPFEGPGSAGGSGGSALREAAIGKYICGPGRFCTLAPGSPALASGMLNLSRPPDPHFLKVSLGQAPDTLTRVAGGELPEGPACGTDHRPSICCSPVLSSSEARGRNHVWFIVASQAPYSPGPPRLPSVDFAASGHRVPWLKSATEANPTRLVLACC